MNKIETLKAISLVSDEMPTLVRSKKGFGYNYTPLDTIMKDLRPLLSKHGLSLVHYTNTNDNGENVLITEVVSLIKESSPVVSTSTMKPTTLAKMNAYQVEGSALTYFRRYHISMIFSLNSEEDNDSKLGKPKANSSSNGNIKPAIVSGDKFVTMFTGLVNKATMDGPKLKRHYDNNLDAMPKDTAEKIKNLINSKYKETIK